MHITDVSIHPNKFPTKEYYPFNLELFHKTDNINFESPVTFFIGENGTGKTTLLKALANKCDIHIWQAHERTRYDYNPYENYFHTTISINWQNEPVPGSFFASQTFRHFTENLDEWASMDPKLLDYFGGESLVSKSHGQSLMAFFKSRYERTGIYLLDEPETALSPKSQIELLRILNHFTQNGNTQFIIATHSPILLACPGAKIYSFDEDVVKEIDYEQTEYFQVYKDFLNNRDHFLNGI